MIADVRFGKALDPKLKNTSFYVYQNSSDIVLISPHFLEHYIPESEIPAILSHETLHKIILQLEGKKACSALDKFCALREWNFQDNSGIASFFDPTTGDRY